MCDVMLCVVADRVALLDPQKVDEAQDVLLTALHFLAAKHSRRPHVKALTDVMLQLRTLSHHYKEWEENFSLVWSKEFEIPPLLCEMTSAT